VLDDTGRAYYQFGAWNLRELRYSPDRPLLLGFDFNVAPGVAIGAQDMDMAVDVLVCSRCTMPVSGKSGERCRCGGALQPFERVTGVLDEVWIDDDSNTRVVTSSRLKNASDVVRVWRPELPAPGRGPRDDADGRGRRPGRGAGPEAYAHQRRARLPAVPAVRVAGGGRKSAAHSSCHVARVPEHGEARILSMASRIAKLLVGQATPILLPEMRS
jgi:hypothetical protein